ncbi:MAG TPA: hypothetical protein VHD83_22600 [Puia sp.]|nr:hypothetical protein [Puia sp.]
MHSNRIIICLLILAVAFNSCVKQKFDTPTLAEFAAPVAGNQGSYFILPNDPSSEFKIPIGITTTSGKDRTVNFTVTSPTGAVAGTQYTIASNSITIPAGKAVDSISVKGIYDAYPSGRIDTLIFTITGGDAGVYTGSEKYTLVVQKYCDVVSTDLVGDYASSDDLYEGEGSGAAPYTVNISNWTSTGPTSATITLKNFGATPDNGFGPFAPTDAAATGITAKLDWSDPSNFTVTIPSQPYKGAVLTYGPGKIAGSGSFSSCLETFKITFVVSVGLGDFDPITTVMAR